MLQFLPANIKGLLAITAYVLNTILVTVPLIIIALFKLIIPFKPWRKFCTRRIMQLANLWVSFNSLSMQQLNNIKFNVTGDTDLKRDGWYLIIANHQSWADIVVMQHVLQSKIPFLTFFLKQELIYIPLLGLAWWALDFPFMKRFSKSKLRKNPHLKGKDIEATKKACEKFKTQPISIVNFVEGTRFSEQKSISQGRPFKHLLRPRAGGAGYVMTLMGDQIEFILNLTISYPDQQGHYWSFLTGKLREITVHIEAIPVTELHQGNYIDDQEFRASFQRWMSELWQQKDQQIHQQRQHNK